MKKFFCAVTLALTIFSTEICAATDIWVDSWQDSNIDIYVIEDTIKSNSAENNFSVSVKEVRGANLLKIIEWKFSKVDGDFWRYETSEMDGEHLTAVIPRNMIFEFCMRKLNRAYKIVDYWYY